MKILLVFGCVILTLSLVVLVYEVISNKMPVDIGLLAVVAAAAISLISLPITKNLEISNQNKKELQTQKRQVYSDLIFNLSFMFRHTREEIAADEKDKEKESQKKIQTAVENISQIHPKLVLWGSAEVVRQYSHLNDFLRKLPEIKQAQKPEIAFKTMLLFERLWLAMRKDVGQINKPLKEGDVISIFITDFREAQAKAQAK